MYSQLLIWLIYKVRTCGTGNVRNLPRFFFVTSRAGPTFTNKKKNTKMTIFQLLAEGELEVG